MTKETLPTLDEIEKYINAAYSELAQDIAKAKKEEGNAHDEKRLTAVKKNLGIL